MLDRPWPDSTRDGAAQEADGGAPAAAGWDGRARQWTIVLLADSDGEQYFLSCLQDVSEELMAHDLLRLVVENTPVSISVVDQNGRVLMSEGNASPEAAARLSEARETSIFQSFADQPKGVSSLKMALGGEYVHKIVEAFGRHFDMDFVPIPGAGNKGRSIAAVATDITEQQEAVTELPLRSAEQALVADLGRQALEAKDPRVLWERAVTSLTNHLGADLVQAYELDGDGDYVGLLAREDRSGAPPGATRVGPVEDTGGAEVTAATWGSGSSRRPARQAACVDRDQTAGGSEAIHRAECPVH